MELVKRMSELDEILKGQILNGALVLSQIVDCKGKGIKELVEARHVFTRDKKAAFVAERVKGQGLLLANPIHKFCEMKEVWVSGGKHSSVISPPSMEDKEVLEFVRQGGNFWE